MDSVCETDETASPGIKRKSVGNKPATKQEKILIHEEHCITSQMSHFKLAGSPMHKILIYCTQKKVGTGILLTIPCPLDGALSSLYSTK